MQIRFSLTLACLFLFYLTFCQNNNYYFDDSGISGSKNIIKVNGASIIVGDLSIAYERILLDGFSIELAPGLILPYYVPEFPISIFRRMKSNDVNTLTPKSGFSLMAQPKIYYQRKAPEMAYISLAVRNRNYFLEYGNTSFYDFYFNSGAQLILGKRIALDYSVGVGYRFENNSNPNFDTGLSGLIVPLSIKTGLIY